MFWKETLPFNEYYLYNNSKRKEGKSVMNDKQKALRKKVIPFEKIETKRSLWQLTNTVVPFLLIWVLACYTIEVSYIVTFGLLVLNAGFLIRLFIIFHDCTHYSFFNQRKANEVVGTILGVLTLFPYNQWKHTHTVHHATSGNLDKRGIGDIWVMTVKEYEQAPKWLTFKYKLYRNPFVMFLVGPIYVFIVGQRFNRKKAKKREKINTYITNASILSLFVLLSLLIGWEKLILIQAPIFLLSGSMGVWLFYVQHQFEDTYFEWDKDWEYVRAAIEGSSYYKLPKVLQWFTGNIGFHHIHHLSPRVPNYQLEIAHEKIDELRCVPTVTLKTSLKALSFKLWDDEQNKFITFKEVKRVESKTSLHKRLEEYIPVQKEKWNMHIKELNLNLDQYKKLKDGGVETVGELLKKTRHELNELIDWKEDKVELLIQRLESLVEKPVY